MKRKKKASSSSAPKTKARVGRKAPQPANQTDTSFRAASVRVAAQQVLHQQQPCRQQGRPLSELLGRLRGHPSAGARLSSIKGLRDLVLLRSNADADADAYADGNVTVGASSATSSAIASSSNVVDRDNRRPGPRGKIRTLRSQPQQQHLSVLLPVVVPSLLSASLMDEDDRVRSEGLDLLEDIFVDREGRGEDDRASGSAPPLTPPPPPHHHHCCYSPVIPATLALSLRPFLPLWVAQLGSALNSLDPLRRLHGARAVSVAIGPLFPVGRGLARHGGGQEQRHPSLSSSMAALLPALVRVLREQPLMGGGGGECGGGKSSRLGAGRSGAGERRTRTQRHREPATAMSMVLRSFLPVLAALLVAAGDSIDDDDDDERSARTLLSVHDLPTNSIPPPIPPVLQPCSMRRRTIGWQPERLRSAADVGAPSLLHTRRYGRASHGVDGGSVDGRSLLADDTSPPLSLSASLHKCLLDLLEGLRDVLIDATTPLAADAASSIAGVGATLGGRNTAAVAAALPTEAFRLALELVPVVVHLILATTISPVRIVYPASERDDAGAGPIESRSAVHPTEERFRRISSQILSCLMKVFPLGREDRDKEWWMESRVGSEQGPGDSELPSSPDGVADGSASGAAANAQLCLALLALSAQPSPQPRGRRSKADQRKPAAGDNLACQVVVEYVTSVLRGIWPQWSADSVSGPFLNNQRRRYEHPAILTVLEKLLDPSSAHSASPSTQGRLTLKFVSAFFDGGFRGFVPGHNDDDPGDSLNVYNDQDEWLRSETARKSVWLARRVVFRHHQYDLSKIRVAFREVAEPENNKEKDVAERILCRLPLFLVAWRADFLPESRVALALLHEVVRRLPSRNMRRQQHSLNKLSEVYDDEDAVAHITVGLVPLMLAQRSAQRTGSSQQLSIFEQYPEELQRQVLGIYVLAEHLPLDALTALGAMCSRYRRRPLRREYSSLHPHTTFCLPIAIETVHALRRTLPMQAYLAFVLESTGILDVKEVELMLEGEAAAVSAPINEPHQGGGADLNSSGLPHPPSRPACSSQRIVEQIVAFDPSLCTAMRLLTDCGAPLAAKVLPMLRPFLSSCLNASLDRLAPTPRRDLLRSRAALAMVGSFLLAAGADDPTCLLRALPPGLAHADALAASIVEFCSRALEVVDCGPQAGDGGTAENVDTLFRPVVALLSIEPLELLERVFQQALSCGGGTGEEDANGMRGAAAETAPSSSTADQRAVASSLHSRSSSTRYQNRLRALLFLVRMAELRPRLVSSARALLEMVLRSGAAVLPTRSSTTGMPPSAPANCGDALSLDENDAFRKIPRVESPASAGDDGLASGPERVWTERLVAELSSISFAAAASTA